MILSIHAVTVITNNASTLIYVDVASITCEAGIAFTMIRGDKIDTLTSTVAGVRQAVVSVDFAQLALITWLAVAGVGVDTVNALTISALNSNAIVYIYFARAAIKPV